MAVPLVQHSRTVACVQFLQGRCIQPQPLLPGCFLEMPRVFAGAS
jgi:hypothetical protein